MKKPHVRKNVRDDEQGGRIWRGQQIDVVGPLALSFDEVEYSQSGRKAYVVTITRGRKTVFQEFFDSRVKAFNLYIDKLQTAKSEYLLVTKKNPPKKKAKKNPPPLYGGRTRKVGAKFMIGLRVYEIRYQHAADGLDYKHPFETGAILWGMPDGSLVIESATGARLWENRDV